jgi:hypothetical protein
MSFAQCAPRSFTVASVQKNAPECSGVYGLSNDRDWIFIGEAHDLRARLLEHLSEIDTPLAYKRPVGFAYEECSPLDRVERQSALVRQFAPVCNRRVV